MVKTNPGENRVLVYQTENTNSRMRLASEARQLFPLVIQSRLISMPLCGHLWTLGVESQCTRQRDEILTQSYLYCLMVTERGS